jgi:hypothetical protein
LRRLCHGLRRLCITTIGYPHLLAILPDG